MNPTSLCGLYIFGFGSAMPSKKTDENQIHQNLELKGFIGYATTQEQANSSDLQMITLLKSRHEYYDSYCLMNFLFKSETCALST